MLPLKVDGIWVETTPVGPSHWKSGMSVTPLGREREQVRVTVAPAMTGDEGEEVSEMVAGTVREQYRLRNSRLHLFIPIV